MCMCVITLVYGNVINYIVTLIHWIETPLFRYLVFSDPPGAKIGNGGATMHALEQLEMVIGWEQLEKGTVTAIIVLLQ